MSISSEISRISGNIRSALQKIASKGVTVPSGSNSDDLAGLIDEIPVYEHVTISQGLVKSGLSDYFNSGTSSSYDVSIAPKYSNSEGVVSAHTNQTGTTEYYKVKTAAPKFKGGGISGTVGLSSSSASISDIINNSGIEINGSAAVSRAALLYNGALAGWVEKADGDSAVSATSKTLNSDTYYINSVSIGVPPSGTYTFSITVPNGINDTVTFNFEVSSSGNVRIT